MAGRLLPLALPVRVKSRNTAGKKFTEKSFLKDISYRGAFFELRNEVDRDDIVTLLIDPERSGYKGQDKVVRQEPVAGAQGYGIGVRF